METTCQRHIIQGHFKTPPVLKKDYFIYSLYPRVYFCCRSQPQCSYSTPAQPTELPFLFEPPSPLQPQCCGSCLLWGKVLGIVHIPELPDLKVQLWKVSRSTWRKGDWEAPSSGWQSPAGEGHVGHTLLPSPAAAFQGEKKSYRAEAGGARELLTQCFHSPSTGTAPRAGLS